MSSAPISPASNIPAKNNIEISRSNVSLKGIVLGETLQTIVVDKLAGNKYLMALKNLQIPAETNIPLNVGEKLVVRVDSLRPQIILHIVGSENQNAAHQINEKLRQWRTNPESLLQVIDKVAGLAKLLQGVELSPAFSKSDMVKLIKLFDNIIFSPRTKNNPLFLKEFVAKIGLMLENSLSKVVSDPSKGRITKPLEDNLKALVSKLSSTAGDALRENSKLDIETTAKLTTILAFADEALKAIEVKQALNSVFQDSDNGLVLQVPVALADGFRLADIFITPEGKNGEGKTKFSSCSVTIFLDLDILGKIAVNAGLREGHFNCVIKCENMLVKDLVSDNLDELKQLLSGTGYRLGYIDCLQEDGLIDERQEFIAGQSFAAAELVNFFA